jgi:hypothetical protein
VEYSGDRLIDWQVATDIGHNKPEGGVPHQRAQVVQHAGRKVVDTYNPVTASYQGLA